jgi:hypothetical protein
MNKIILSIVAIVGLLIGGYAGRTLFPKVETKEIEKIQKDIVTIVKEIVKADGTKEVVTTITDHSKENKVTTTVPQKVDNWHLSVSDSKASLNSPDVYGIQIERKLMGPVSLGLRVQTDKVIGITMGVSF